MSIQNVVVNPRTELGKGPSKRLRKAGMIPSVVYGMGEESVSVSVLPKAITQVIRSEKGLNSVLNLSLADTEDSRHVMIKSVDRHPVTDGLTHVDFLRVDMNKKVDATIPLRLVGSPAGVKEGGVLTTVRHELDIECLPTHLVGRIDVDVSHLGLDQTLRIGDLPEFEGVTFKLGPTRMIAVVRTEKGPAADEEVEAETETATEEVAGAE